MKWITSEEIEWLLGEHGVQWVLQNYGRYRIAPGWSVADHVKVGEFFNTAGRFLRCGHPTGVLIEQ